MEKIQENMYFDVFSCMKTYKHACLLVISCASSTFTPNIQTLYHYDVMGCKREH